MDYKELDEIFKDQDFDLAEPVSGHRERFLKKLRDRKGQPAKGGGIRKLWSPIAAVAAALLLIFMVTGNMLGPVFDGTADLAGISPEMKETQKFYTSVIKTELAKLEAEKSPETEALVKDALLQLEKLDVSYEKLKKDLKKSGGDKRVIFAMVSNLQQRIDLLNNVLSHIEDIKELKNIENENYIL